MAVVSAQFARARTLDQSIPPLLRPVLRAYILGYASSTAPRLLTLLLTHLTRRRKHIIDRPEDCFLPSLARILKGALEWQRFPTFCAALTGFKSIFEVLLRGVFALLPTNLSSVARLRLTRWLSAAIAAWLSLKILQSKESAAFIDRSASDASTENAPRPKRFAGRTMDLTLFAVTRALDVIVGELWYRHKARRTSAGKWTLIEKIISNLTDSAIFATSSALIMWCWIYIPALLPRAYNKWITSAAAVDQRLLLTLRNVRYGVTKYGIETGQAHVLEEMCSDYNWPLDYGDPVKSIPFPCEMVHMGTGRSCEYHGVSRLGRSFLWAFSTYLPLNLALTVRNPTKKGLTRALRSSVRSSAFLGAFIALYYYGICLARNRIGPLVIGTSVSARQQTDSGFAIGSGCMLCGWSILLETEGRRKDIALFVAPRAMATLLPRRYALEKQWRETLAFAVSTAVVFTCVEERPERVRGVLGRVLSGVLIP